ncbi:hypothetical protein CVU37_01320 [candidate division BRC1 bacterium HGW-BRC1-1]|jgi:diguanylate cyclase (GGDEF)-like protein|nr:MAG: hypothetical protein CVU37_01320 [candidate division BRC1 bacterium HGW-BRC1-1]
MISLPASHLRRPFIGYLLVSALLFWAAAGLGKTYRLEGSLTSSWLSIFLYLTSLTLCITVTAVGALLGASLWFQSKSQASFAATVVYGTLFMLQLFRVLEVQKTGSTEGSAHIWMILSAFIVGWAMLGIGLMRKRATSPPVPIWVFPGFTAGGVFLLFILALALKLIHPPVLPEISLVFFIALFMLLAMGSMGFTVQALKLLEARRDGLSTGLVLMVVLLVIGSFLSVFLQSDATAAGTAVLEILALGAVPFGFAVDGIYAIRRMGIYERGGTDEVMLDPLTGLANRRALELTSRMMFADCLASGRPLSVLMLDIDHFKMVNDLHGHAAGDEVLRRFARIIADAAGESDLAARYGGEEFLMVMPGAPLAPAMRLAERIRSLVQETPFSHEKGTLSLTVSVGVATAFPGEAAGVDKLISTADKNLYRAKRRGRNCVQANPLPGEQDAVS